MTRENLGYPASKMGPRLRALVEEQLLVDLQHYGVTSGRLKVDWSDPCQEGHVTECLDGRLEEMSGIRILDPGGSPVAEGWVDFIHGGGEAPLYAFWLFLRIRVDNGWRKVKKHPVIPVHVWEELPELSKELCAKEDGYDARWHRDPLVVDWKRRRRPQ
jgi:hypothetical protein